MLELKTFKEFLIERSAPITKTEYKQCDELVELVSQSKIKNIADVHKLIQKGCSPDSMNIGRKTVLILMVQRTRGNWDYFDIKEFLETHNPNVNAQDVRGATALHFACIRDDIRLVELLLKYNADKDILDKQGNPPKHYAGVNTRHLV